MSAKTDSEVTNARCLIYGNCAWIYCTTNGAQMTMNHVPPETITVTQSGGTFVPICITSPEENGKVTAFAKKNKFTGKLVKYDDETAEILQDNGHYIIVNYNALEFHSNPRESVIRWVADTPVDIGYKTSMVKWTNILEIRVIPGYCSIISDTALIDSDLPYRFEGDVTLVKSEKSTRTYDSSERLGMVRSLAGGSSSDESGVATNGEIHKHIGRIALPQLLRLELGTAPFEYSQVYAIALGSNSKGVNAEIQLETISPWYVQPATLNLHYGNYHTSYGVPAYRQGELMRLPVAKSPEVSYTTQVSYTKTEVSGNLYQYDVSILVTVTDTHENRRKMLLYSLETKDYQVVSTSPTPTAGIQKPGSIHWKAVTEESQSETTINVVLRGNGGYFSL